MDPMRKKKIVSEDLIMAIFGNVRVLLNMILVVPTMRMRTWVL